MRCLVRPSIAILFVVACSSQVPTSPITACLRDDQCSNGQVCDVAAELCITLAGEGEGEGIIGEGEGEGIIGEGEGEGIIGEGEGEGIIGEGEGEGVIGEGEGEGMMGEGEGEGDIGELPLICDGEAVRLTAGTTFEVPGGANGNFCLLIDVPAAHTAIVASDADALLLFTRAGLPIGNNAGNDAERIATVTSTPEARTLVVSAVDNGSREVRYTTLIDVGNDDAHAEPLQIGSQIPGSIAVRDDIDVFTFEVPADGGTLSVSLTAPNPVVLSWVISNSQDMVAIGSSETESSTNLVAGVYFIKIGALISDTGAYGLLLTLN
jgi:hypothetical protein